MDNTLKLVNKKLIIITGKGGVGKSSAAPFLPPMRQFREKVLILEDSACEQIALFGKAARCLQ